MNKTLRPHQERAVQQLDNGKILWGGVGSGKSLTALAYYVKKERKQHIYIITTAKKRDELDWEREAAAFGIDKDVSLYGLLTVDSWNNISKYEGVNDGFFIFDEQRLVGNGAWVKSFLKIAKSNRWILLSATPGDTWLDYAPVFIANGFYRNITEFRTEHVVYDSWAKFPKVKSYLSVSKLLKYRARLLVGMPYERHTNRHVQYLSLPHDKDLMKKVVDKRWHVYEERPLKDVTELFRVMRKVVNSDSSRIEKLRQLLTSHPKLIVFYNFNYELEMMRKLLNQLNEPFESSMSQGNIPSSSDICLSTTTSSSKKRSNPTSSDTSSCGLSEPESKSKTSKTSPYPGGPSTQEANSLDSGYINVDEVECSANSPNGPYPVGFAEWNGQKHEPLPKTDRWVYLVQYTAGAEGWNCIETDAMVFFSQTYSYKTFEQALGRIDRMNTKFKDLYYYVFTSDSAIDRAIRKAIRDKKTFNERDFVRKEGFVPKKCQKSA